LKSVTHCVRSDSFAGVERYVSSVAPELERRGWDVRVVGGDPERMRAELGAINYMPAATTLAVTAQLMRADRGTIVHAHMTAAEVAAAVAHELRRFPLVVTRHFASPRGTAHLTRLGARLITRAIDRQVSISRFVAESIGEGSIVILNGVPSTQSRPESEPMVLVAQRLEREKQTEVAIRAWEESRLRRDGWQLTIAGRGSQSSDLAHLVKRLHLQDSVDFVGVQADMRPLMKRAGIFLAAAPAEPFGLSVVEAMAAGLPIIAASGGAHLETVGAVSEQCLFPAGDWRRAAALLDELGANPDERRQVGAALQAWQRQYLTIETHVDQLEELYEELRR
jgi:glycosyltransferase involved in cell wall biosynthesis